MPVPHSDESTQWGLSFTRICLHYIVLCFTWTCFLYRSLTCTWTFLISTRTAPMSTQTESRSILTPSLSTPMASASIATVWANTLRPLQAVSWLISNFTASTYTFTVIQSFSRLYRHSHGLFNNLKALENPYPKNKVLLEAVKMLLEAMIVLIEAVSVLAQAVKMLVETVQVLTKF